MIKSINGGKLPIKGTEYSACVDLYANEDITFYTGQTKIVGLGVCIDDDWLRGKFTEHLDENSDKAEKLEAVEQYELFKQGHYLSLHPRSSLRAKGLVSNTGIIDIDYDKEIKIIFHSLKDEPFTIKKGDRVAQLMLCEHKSYLFDITSEETRHGGFGSTDEL